MASKQTSDKKNDPLKIIISVRQVGGVGGVERHLMETTKALHDCQIDIFGINTVLDNYYPHFEHVKIFDLHEAIKQRKLTPKEYDIYIQYGVQKTYYLSGKYFSSKIKLIVPCGNSIIDVEDKFDYVINETEDGIRYLRDHGKHIALIPPVTKIAEKTKKVEGLPENFFLTIFNPYNLKRCYNNGLKPYKGYDVLYEIAPRVNYPIVWGYNNASVFKKNVKIIKNIIYKENLSQEEIAYLYEKCQAYICFSREEGFGFALADAFLYQKPIFTRNVGIATLFNKDTVNQYDSEDELIKKLNGCSNSPADHCAYDLHKFSQEAFRKRFYSLLKKNF